MGNYKKLGRNIALLTIGNFASRILSFLLVPFYTSILSTAEYGTADMVTTSVNLIMPIFSLLVYEAVMRFCLESNSDKKQIFSIGLYVTIIGCFVLLIIIQILRFSSYTKDYIWQFVFYYVSLVMYNLILQFVKGLEKVSVYSIAGVINTFVYIACNIFFLIVLKWGVKGYLTAFIVGNMVSALYAFVSARVYRYIIGFSKIKLVLLREMINYATPMIPNAISWWISNSSDKYILVYFWGIAVNGIYTVAYKIPSILTIGISIFIGAWQISAVDNFGSEESKKFYADIYNKYECLLYIGTAALIGLVKILSKFLFANDFYLAWLYTPILICASVFNSLASFYGSIYTSSKKTGMLFYSTLIGAGGNIILNFILIPPFGAMGAAIATMVSYIIVWGVRAVHSRRLLAFELNIKRNCIIYLILGVEVLLITADINPYFSVSIAATLLITYSCRSVVIETLNLFMNRFRKA